MTTIPCDTSMWEIPDPVDPLSADRCSKMLFARYSVARSWRRWVFMEQGYLLKLDGTGYFNVSENQSFPENYSQ